ncbi:MAG TPA: 2OG-Fe(II) oxygenase [Cellvibrionaceae bacterium]|nr:2OG-Fe(II) oxygenase [Cellvibrionaceae bacterium]
MNEIELKANDSAFSIRGHTFRLDELVNPLLYDPVQQDRWATLLQTAAPYPHLNVMDWFNKDFLNLILEEFVLSKNLDWRVAQTDMVNFRRSVLGEYLGPATELYFTIVNSGWFVQLLSQISGVGDLIVDHSRYGGGMHETVKGGYFSVHSDFNRHVTTGLTNKMVFITYLTPGWQPDWAGELELWDKDNKQCITKIAPNFGRSVLMLNGKGHYHGHPSIWNAPAGIPRRSVANYYYVNEYAAFDRSEHYDSIYISPNQSEKFVAFVRPVIPPLIWQAIRKILGRP